MSTVLTTTTKGLLLDGSSIAVLVTHTSLHSGHPGSTGANELSGGSPAYARNAVGWDAAAAGCVAMTGTETFNVPASTTVRYVGFWSAITAGTFRGFAPAGSTARVSFTVDAGGVTANEFDSPAHGLVNGDAVLVWPTIGAGLPTGVAEDTVYFVVGTTTDTFQLSLTSGGAAIDITAIGDGDVQKLTPETFTAPGSYQLSSLQVCLPG